MKFTNPFSTRKPTEQLNVPVLAFVGEQDGPPERLLKGKLSELLGTRQGVTRAYLARVHYGNPNNISVCLCLVASGRAQEPLVEAIHSLFAQHFNRAVHLDIVFLKRDQEDQLTAVCQPFFQSN